MRGQDFFSPSLFLVTTTHAVGRQWAAEGCVRPGYKDPGGDEDKRLWFGPHTAAPYPACHRSEV